MVTVTKVSLVGGIRVRVPHDAVVEVEGLDLSSLLGRRAPVPAPVPGDRPAPRVLIRAYGVVGGVAVERA